MASEWVSAPLSDLTDPETPVTYGVVKPGPEDPDRGVLFIRGGDIAQGRVLTEQLRTITREVSEQYRRTQLRGGEIVVSLVGNPGQVAIVPESLRGANIARQTGLVRLREDIDTRFVKYFLSSRVGQQALGAHSLGSVQQVINLRDLKTIRIPVPPLPEQRAIAHILGTLDDKIELNRRMNQTLEAMARALFKSWFVDFDPVRAKAEGRDTGLPPNIAELFPDSFEDSELGEIPRGWMITSLGELFPSDDQCVLTGPFGSNLHAHDYRREGTPLILVKHVVGGGILDEGLPLVGEHKSPELERYRLHQGDIVFTRVGAVGRAAYAHARNVGWLISGQLLRVRVPDWRRLHPRYLSQVFLEKAFMAMVEGQALGTTRPSLNTELLRAFRFVAPPGSVSQRFADMAAPCDSLVEARREEMRTLAALRDALLPRLISGKLIVSPGPLSAGGG